MTEMQQSAMHTPDGLGSHPTEQLRLPERVPENPLGPVSLPSGLDVRVPSRCPKCLSPRSTST